MAAQKQTRTELTQFEENHRKQLEVLQRQMLAEAEELKQLQNSKKQLLVCWSPRSWFCCLVT